MATRAKNEDITHSEVEMMENTVKQENETNNTPKGGAEEKTFTQAELDAIVSDRLKRERAKYEGFDELKAKADELDALKEANKTELQKATEKAQALEAELATMKKADELRSLREKVAKEKGVPVELLHGESEETCTAEADGILNFAKASGGYPSVKDGGEVTNTTKPSTRQQFAEWWNKQD